MKIWTHSFFKRPNTEKIFGTLRQWRPLLQQAKTIADFTYQIAKAMLGHIHEWQPKRYFVVYHHGNATDIILHEESGNQTVKTIKHVHDIDSTLEAMAKASPPPFLHQSSSIPVMLVAHSPECEIKMFDLSRVPFWKRWSVTRKVEENLAQSNNIRTISSWIQKAYVNQIQQNITGKSICARYAWFGALKMNASLATLEDWLNRQKRPVIAARWAPIMLAEHLWKSISPSPTTWTVILCPFEEIGFQLFVYNQRTLVFYRQGFINSFTTGGLQEEVQQTMHYGERLGYLPSSPFRVMCYGFTPSQQNYTGEWHWNDMPDTKDWITPPTKRWWDCLIFFFKQPSLESTELSPLRFISSWMAFHLPRWVAAVGVPLIHLTFWTVVVLWMKSSYLSHTLQSFEPFATKAQTHQSQQAAKIIRASVFESFINNHKHQPTSLLHRVTPMLGQAGIIQRIQYDSSKKNEHSLQLHLSNKTAKSTAAHVRKSLGEKNFRVDLNAQNVLDIAQCY